MMLDHKATERDERSQGSRDRDITRQYREMRDHQAVEINDR